MSNAGLENWKQDGTCMRVNEPDAPADERIWQLRGPSRGVLSLKVINDCVTCHSELLITRTGARISRVELDGVEIYAAP